MDTSPRRTSKAMSSSTARSSWVSESDFESDHSNLCRLTSESSSLSTTHFRHCSPSASETSSAVGGKGVPGSARWLKERNEALEAERLALVKQTLEVQVFLKSVKQKVNTAIDIGTNILRSSSTAP